MSLRWLGGLCDVHGPLRARIHRVRGLLHVHLHEVLHVRWQRVDLPVQLVRDVHLCDAGIYIWNCINAGISRMKYTYIWNCINAGISRMMCTYIRNCINAAISRMMCTSIRNCINAGNSRMVCTI